MSDETSVQIARLHDAVFGNGRTGLCKNVEEIQSYVLQLRGGISVLKWAVSFLGASNIAAFVLLLAK